MHYICDLITSTSRFSHVFWIDASSEDTIALGLKGLCSHPEAKAAGICVSSKSAVIWIGSLQSEWLLVFDSADGAPEVVEKFIPSGSLGNILVTSRNRSLGRVTSYVNSVEIDQMAEEDAILLLLKASHITEQSENVCSIAQQIVNKLCCLPLAIDQAGASIEAGLCRIDSYLGHLSQHINKLMNHPSFRGASQYDRTAYETWDLSFNKIELMTKNKYNEHDTAAAQAAILILETAAFLHHENIMEAAFKKAAMEFSKRQHCRLEEKVKTCINRLLHLEKDQSWNQFFFCEGIRVLMSFSLIKQISASSGIYAIHPLVHKWSRDRMSVSQKKCMMQVSKLILVNCITMEMTAENIAFNRFLVPHIKANYQSQQENGFEGVFDDDECSRFSHVLDESGMWKYAEYFQHKIVEVRIKKQGPEHPNSLASMNNLAMTYSNQGKYEEAAQLQLKVLDLYKRALGPEHPDTLCSMNNIAFIYSNQGKYKEAVQLHLKVLDLHKRAMGPEHPNTLISMSNLALTYSNQGKYEEAAQLQLKVLDLHKRVLAPEHLNTLDSMNDLATTYSYQGKYEEAAQLQLKVLDLRRRVLGPEHPNTLTTINNLAFSYSNQGKYEEAAELQLKVLGLGNKVLGPEHPLTLSIMRNLAGTYSKQAKYEEASQLQPRVLDLHNRVLGPEHPDTLNCMNGLALIYSNQGKYEEAAQLQLKVLDLHKRVLGPEHPNTLISINNLAMTYSNQGQYEDAVQLHLKVLDLHNRVLGPEHPDTLNSMNNLAFTYSNQGNYEEAAQLQLTVLDLHRRVLGPEHPNTLTSINNLAFSYSNQGKYEEASQLQLRVVDLCDRVLGPEHPNSLASIRNLALTYSEQGKYEEATQL